MSGSLTLEQKVKERTRKLEKVNEDLEDANRRVVRASQLQLQHFACMSHEIRYVSLLVKTRRVFLYNPSCHSNLFM